MKAGKKIKIFILMACLAFAGVLASPDSVHAKKIASAAQAKALALAKVKNAVVTDVDLDRVNGVQVYDVELVKGTKKYDLVYRVSDGKLLAYGWEKRNVAASSTKKLIGTSKCRSLALKQVKNGSVLSLVHKYDDGIDIYKVKMTAAGRNYTLVYHARTGALIEYEWEITVSSNTAGSYIGVDKAKAIALKSVPGATVIKAEFDTDDGVPIYEVELIKGAYEYELKIHAKTGTVLEKDRDVRD